MRCMSVAVQRTQSFSSARVSVNQVLLRLCTALVMIVGVALASAPAQAAGPPGLALAQTQQLEGKVNINTASADQLQMLPGVGPATASKILEYRIRRRFSHPSHIMRVKGIGKKTYAELRRYIAVEGETTLHMAPAS